MAKFTWNDENVAVLEGSVSGLVTQDQLKELAEQLGTTPRSVGSKLRKMGHEVEKATAANKSKWTEAEDAALVDYLQANEGSLTYAEVAATLLAGKFTTKQVQGKILSLELTHMVKPTEKAVTARTYSEAEEAKIVELVNAESELEVIAEAVGRPLNSVRGKCLSLLKEGRISGMPVQATSSAKPRTDIFEGLNVAEMTVAELAEAVGRTERGIKATLTRRGIDASDYNGAAKAAKIADKAE